MKNGPSIGFNTFQLTSPRGDELKMARVLVRVYHFNSCLREETNVYDKFMYDLRQLFQLTSLQRDEQVLSPFVYILLYFNSRLRKGTNIKQFLYSYHFCYFNSRLREETNPAEPTTSFSTKLISNHVFFFASSCSLYFNSRLRKETNSTAGGRLALELIFQLTSP